MHTHTHTNYPSTLLSLSWIFRRFISDCQCLGSVIPAPYSIKGERSGGRWGTAGELPSNLGKYLQIHLTQTNTKRRKKTEREVEGRSGIKERDPHRLPTPPPPVYREQNYQCACEAEAAST